MGRVGVAYANADQGAMVTNNAITLAKLKILNATAANAAGLGADA